jgi:hypothetical protein
MPKTSPLDRTADQAFKSLILPINENPFVTATFVRTENIGPSMKTSTERTPTHIKNMKCTSSIDGQALKLNVYKNIGFSQKKERI